MKKAVFVLCEGGHDVAFLYRLLKSAGFSVNSKAIREYPEPLSGFLLKALRSIDFGDQRPDSRNFPGHLPDVLVRDENETMVFLYQLGGDSKKEERNRFVDRVICLKPEEADDFDDGEEFDYSILFFFDANCKGKEARLRDLEGELRTLGVPEGAFSDSGGNGFCEVNGVRLGCFVFAGENGSGALEDILLPLMEKGNEEIFEKAESFLKLKDDERLKRLSISKDEDGSIFEKRSKKNCSFSEAKAKIGIAGQLQESGAANTVIIKYCDYLKLDKIQASPQCREIIEYIESAIAII